MASRSRARARARARAKSSVSFGAGVSPENLAPPTMADKDAELKRMADEVGMPGYGGNFSDVDPRVLRGGAEIAGAGIGTVLAGGNPLGGAAGYALVDQLFDKYQKGEEITPVGASKSLATGAAYEALPTGLLYGAGKLLPKDFAQNLMRRAIKPPAGQSDDYSEKMAQYMLDTDRNISRKTVNKAGENVRTANEAANRRIAERAAAGERVDPLSISSSHRAEGYNRYKGIETRGADDALEKIEVNVQHWLDKQKGKYGSQEGTSYPESMPLEDAFEQRKNLDKMAGGEFIKQQTKRNYQPTMTQREMDDIVDLANSIRKEINKDPVTAEMMKTQKGELDLIRLVQEKLNKQGSKSLIPSEVMLPLIFETGLKGTPGLATAMGLGRAAGSNPRFLSSAALKANKLAQGRYQAPDMYKTLIAENMAKAYGRENK